MTDLKTAGATLPEHPADKTAKPVAPEVAPVTQPEKSAPEAALGEMAAHGTTTRRCR